MALINKVMPGFSATLWMQTGATPTPLTDAQLSDWDEVKTIIGTVAGGTGTGGVLVPAQNIPAFGAEDASATYSVAGARTGAKITTQNQVMSLQIVCAWNPADAAQLLLQADAQSGTIIRTYVVATYDGTDTVAYAFNARTGGFNIEMSTASEGKFNVTIHPIGGNSFGDSTN